MDHGTGSSASDHRMLSSRAELPATKRLSAFDDPSCFGIVAYDGSGTEYAHIVEALHLDLALRQLTEAVDTNLVEFSRRGLLTDVVVVDVLADSDVNAYAWQNGRCDVVLFNAGLCLCLKFLFDQVVRFTDVFDWVEPEGSGRTPPWRWPRVPTRLSQMLEEAGKVGRGRLEAGAVVYEKTVSFNPIGLERLLLSRWLWEQSLQFVLCHELGHIVRGHTDFLFSSANGAPLTEISQGGRDAEQRLRQELEADCFATQLTFMPIVMRDLKGGGPEFLKNSGGDLNRMYYAWGFALAGMFTVFAMAESGFTRSSFECPSDRTGLSDAFLKGRTTHPHPFVRLSTQANYAVVNALRTVPDLSDTSLADILRGWKDLDAALAQIMDDRYTGYFSQPATFVIDSEIFAPAGEYPWTPFKRIPRGGEGPWISLV